jgi:hypothetical protein
LQFHGRWGIAGTLQPTVMKYTQAQMNRMKEANKARQAAQPLKLIKLVSICILFEGLVCCVCCIFVFFAHVLHLSFKLGSANQFAWLDWKGKGAPTRIRKGGRGQSHIECSSSECSSSRASLSFESKAVQPKQSARSEAQI